MKGMKVHPYWRELESFSFGDGPELADPLCELVVAGVKTATCWPVSEGQQTASTLRCTECSLFSGFG
jgi:uncharacterized protein YhfF